MSDFLPCPFCGSTSINVIEGSTFRWRMPQCDNCGACGPEVRVQTMGEGTPEKWCHDVELECMKVWNTRCNIS